MAPLSAQAQAMTTLHLVQSRRATYHKSRKGAQRPLNWPFALTGTTASNSSIHPDKLADNGLYSTPDDQDATKSTCFCCGTVVTQLSDGDDLVERHQTALERNARQDTLCGWLTLKKLQIEWPQGVLEAKQATSTWSQVLGDEWSQPNSTRLQQARQSSFNVGWPHEGEKGVPTKQQIAAAGWFFRPGLGDASDNCLCPFCTRTVEGWEEGDDPIALHKRKLGLKCPFFLVDSNEETSSQKVLAPTTKLSRSKARTKLVADAQSESEQDVSAEPTTEAAPTASASTRTTRRTASKMPSSPVSVQAAPTKPKRATRQSKRTTVATAIDDSIIIDDVVEQEVPITLDETLNEPVTTSTRSKRATTRAGKKVSTANSSIIVEVPIVKIGASKSKKGKSVQTDAVVAQDVQMETEQDENVEEQIATEVEEEDESEPVVKNPLKKQNPKKGQKSTKGKQVIESTQQVESESATADTTKQQTDDIEAPIATPTGSGSTATVATGKAKSLKSSKSTSKKSSKLKKATTTTSTPILADKDASDVRTSSNVVTRELEPAKTLSPTSKRGPLTPTEAVNLPLASSSSSTATSKSMNEINVDNDPLTKPYVTSAEPSKLFPMSSLDTLTETELSMTISQFYDHIGRQTYNALDKALQREYDEFEKRVRKGRERLLDMLKVARDQEILNGQ
ncbi:hypothetical protein OIO90_006338 [Microbotryomycetes sp. JL221]|nr:hypothetical protein OIO90_006338 [Microbotryomycetes sp. JL221]